MGKEPRAAAPMAQDGRCAATSILDLRRNLHQIVKSFFVALVRDLGDPSITVRKLQMSALRRRAAPVLDTDRKARHRSLTCAFLR